MEEAKAGGRKTVTVCVSVPADTYARLAETAREECRSIPKQVVKLLRDEYGATGSVAAAERGRI